MDAWGRSFSHSASGGHASRHSEWDESHQRQESDSLNYSRTPITGASRSLTDHSAARNSVLNGTYWADGGYAGTGDHTRVTADAITPSLEPPSTRVTSTAPVPKHLRRQSRVCRVAGCDNYIIHKGLCYRHGGGKKCSFEGCESSAKHKGLCWKHGGSVECKVADCTKKAKAKGLCWSHGGGTKCTQDSCPKIAVSHGLCWAHGGGKRCIYDDCQKPAYGRTHGFCLKHYKEVKDVDYYEV